MKETPLIYPIVKFNRRFQAIRSNLEISGYGVGTKGAPALGVAAEQAQFLTLVKSCRHGLIPEMDPFFQQHSGRVPRVAAFLCSEILHVCTAADTVLSSILLMCIMSPRG